MRPLILFALLCPGLLQAQVLPSWQELQFEQRAFWVTAHASLRLDMDPEDPQQWQLTAISSVANNMEQVTVDFDARTGRSLERERLSRGKDQRLKQYHYENALVRRQRRSPPTQAGGSDGGDWPLSSSRDIAFPELAVGEVVVDSYVLLAMAGRLNQQHPELQRVVHTDFNFYRVNCRYIAEATLPADSFPVVAGDRQSKLITRLVRVRAQAFDGNPDKPDFSILGLSGDIELYYHGKTDIPLRLRGRAPRIGNTELRLVALKPRQARLAPTALKARE